MTCRPSFTALQTLLLGDPLPSSLTPKRQRITALRIEQETLIAEIHHARRQHKKASALEADLRAVVTELLTIN